MNTGGLNGESTRELLTGLVTLGSPLEKTAFFYGSRAFTQQKEARRQRRRRPANLQDLPEPFLQQWILSHLHSFRRLPLPTDPTGILVEDPITHHLDKTVWLNFYHLRDLWSDPLDAYSGVYNRRCREDVRGLWKAHNIYWKSDLVYAEIAEQFFK